MKSNHNKSHNCFSENFLGLSNCLSWGLWKSIGGKGLSKADVFMCWTAKGGWWLLSLCFIIILWMMECLYRILIAFCGCEVHAVPKFLWKVFNMKSNKKEVTVRGKATCDLAPQQKHRAPQQFRGRIYRNIFKKHFFYCQVRMKVTFIGHSLAGRIYPAEVNIRDRFQQTLVSVTLNFTPFGISWSGWIFISSVWLPIHWWLLLKALDTFGNYSKYMLA